MDCRWQNTNQDLGFVHFLNKGMATVIRITGVIFRCSRWNEMNQGKAKIQTSESYS